MSGRKRYKIMLKLRLRHVQRIGRLIRHPYLPGRAYCVTCKRRKRREESWLVCCIPDYLAAFDTAYERNYPDCPRCCMLADKFIPDLGDHRFMAVGNYEWHDKAVYDHYEKHHPDVLNRLFGYRYETVP